MPTKKNNIPTGGFIRKQDNSNNPLLPFSAEKMRAYKAGEIDLLQLTSDDRSIKDMPYYQDRYDFNTTTKSYENQDKPTINPFTQRLVNEAYYPEDYAVVDRSHLFFNEGSLSTLDEMDGYFEGRLANEGFHPFAGRLNITGAPIDVSNAYHAISNINPEIADYFGIIFLLQALCLVVGRETRQL